MRWIEHALGLDNASGPLYLWWSGAAGYVFAAVMYFQHNNCHEHRCPRVGRHEYTDEKGVTYKACRKHHPEIEHRKPIRLHEMHFGRRQLFRER